MDHEHWPPPKKPPPQEATWAIREKSILGEIDLLAAFGKESMAGVHSNAGEKEQEVTPLVSK